MKTLMSHKFYLHHPFYIYTKLLPNSSLSSRYIKIEYQQAKALFIYNHTIFTLSASVAESVTFPLDLTKTRLQIQGEVALVRTLDASAIMQKRGMMTMAAGIVREEGLHKLWQVCNTFPFYTGYIRQLYLGYVLGATFVIT